ncbi:type II toxin-antitoxin system RelE/ParE family toxin [Alkalimonas collagenimarina]|uniref:Toxin n=1 Tax=Alkalimonas collagenimarina TaxID=400390 RepID=A0ABT9H0Q4_9GAMM|nr:type II toxin-antitoxin system RelE/ParE family toxin [Alkalimonas collagenimarina]MDP4536882.1 type II toxin-antitoxin system RelE/ParE family toxin [Alkalimonas collagenimarina]
MNQYQLVIAPVAKDDLKTIYQFSVARWGQARADKYLEQLKERFRLLLEQPMLGHERSELITAVRSSPVESHTIFYRITINQIHIIRILHCRQDPNRYLK